MKLINKKMTLLFMGIAVVVLMGATECVCSFAFNDYTAQAVNVKAADSAAGFYKDESLGISLAGVEVSLYAYDATDGSYASTAYASADVQSDGTFTFFSPVSNRYKLTATSDDWIFVPQYIEITNSGASAKDLYAFPADTAGAYTIVTSWENIETDVDLHLTYGSDSATSTVDWTSGTTTAGSDRIHIHHSARGTTSGVYHDMDVTGGDDASDPLVETISIYSNLFFTDNDIIKVYVTAQSGDSLTGEEGVYSSAYAQVDLMYGTTHFGTWYVPWNTSETELQIIEMLYETDGFNSTLTAYSANAAEYNGVDVKSIIWE